LKGRLLLTIMAFIFVLTICGTSSAEDIDKNYTYDNDFDNGALIGLEHNSTPDELQLSNGSQSAFSYIWVPNSNEGTVSKVDTRTGMEVARYRTGPKGNGNPSRTTVDLEGNCWLGNRQTGTAIKIGLLEKGGYIDRNHDGIIETSRDLDGNGVITLDEMLPWGQDECVLYEVVLITGHEGTYTPGNYSGPYVNDNNNPGPRGIAVDSKNNVWIGTFGTMKYYHINGSSGQIMQIVDVSSANHTPYGAVIDQNGILWSSGAGGNNVLRLDPSTGSFKRINLKHFAYGLGLDRNNHLFVAGWDSSCFSRINIITGTVDWTKSCPYQSRGVAVTDNGDVWIANSAAGTVTRYSNDGIFKAIIIAGNTPTGVSVDSYGKVWVVDYGDEYIHRISPTRNETDSSGNIINGVELSKRIIGGTHYGYSDMTGVVSSTITTMKGTWTVIHDSRMDNTPWGFISWTGYEPENTSIRVRVRSSNDEQDWSTWEDAVNGSVLNSILKGRYLQIETTLQRLRGNQSPVLYDLRVTALVADVELNMTVDQPTPHAGENVTFTLKATNNGPRDATGIEIGISLPPNFNVGSPGQGYYQEGIWYLESLASGASALLTIQGMVTPAMAHQVMNCTAERVRQDEYDLTPDVSGASFYLPLVDLEVNATVNKDTLNVGDTAVFTTTIHNNGPDPARGLQIEETSPSGFINLPLPLGNYQNGTWVIPLLESGATITMTSLGVVTEEMAHGNITNTINILQQEYDPTAVKKVENNIYVPLVDLEIVKTAYRDSVAVGGVALLNLTVQNHGPDTARSVVVEKLLPTGFIPGKPFQGIINGDWWFVGDLAPGESAMLLLGHLVAAEGNITSYAEVRTRQHDPNKLNNRQVLNLTAQRRTTTPGAENLSGNSSNPPDLLLNFYNSHSKGTVPMQDTGIPLNIPNLAIILVFCGAYVNKNGIPKNKPLFIFLVVAVAFLLFGTAGAADSSQNYTTDLNFDEGNLTEVEHQTAHDQLQLPSIPDEPEFMWVPNTNEGTVSKVNSKTGAEVARYRTGPLSSACPSRTAVDSEGNCWVANYQTGTLIKIGSNSGTQTSQDLDHNGLITDNELLDWVKDGNVLYEVVLIPGHEGTYTPGKYTGGYANNWANPGPLAVVLDSNDNLWVGCYGLEKYFCIDGATGQILKTTDVSSVGHTPYGAVIDHNGIIWSSGGQYKNVLRLDTKTGSFTRINIPQWAYGLALDSNNHLFVTGYSSSRISRINTLTGQVEWTKTASYGCRGAVVTEDGDVWTANL